MVSSILTTGTMKLVAQVMKASRGVLASFGVQPGRVARILDQLAIQHAGHFVDGVGHQEAAVNTETLASSSGSQAPFA
jgi:cysteine synthase